MQLDPRQCYAALQAQDSRFDGLFYVGVASTGIYCRPICTARTPAAPRCRWFRHAASAEAAGFRPCLRCRPELAPGSAPVDRAKRVAELAVARIEAGALTDGGVDGLAAEFSITARQLRRVIEAEYGVTPVALAQTRRLLLAKQLLTDSSLRIADVAFASGFSSLRRFNHLFRERYGLNPGSLRRRTQSSAEPGAVTLKLGYRPPFDWPALRNFLCGRGSAALEHSDGHRYLRTVRLGERSGWFSVEPAPRGHALQVALSPSLVPVLTPLRARLRQLFDLDANPAVINAQLGAAPALATLIQARPGLRVPGCLDSFELALRAILGQQISVKAASTVFGRFVEHFGESISTPFPGLNRLSPRAEDLAEAPLQSLINRGVTRRRAETIQALAQQIARGALIMRPAADPEGCRQALLTVPGIGPWTADYIAMRALGDLDAWPERDLGLIKALGLDTRRDLNAAAESWRPWRAYAAMHLWNATASGG